MAEQADAGENQRRVLVGRENRKKRGPLSPECRQRLRAAALENQPWRRSTGPRTPAGKAQAARNGKTRQIGPRSVREVRADLAEVAALILATGELREASRRNLLKRRTL
jgi:hypothetical protein